MATMETIAKCLYFSLMTNIKRPRFRVEIGFAAQHACLADELIASWQGYPLLSAEAVPQRFYESLAAWWFTLCHLIISWHRL